MSQSDSTEMLLILCRDLLFASKITSAAQAAGVNFKLIRDASKLAAESDGSRLVVDLNQDGFLEAAAEWKSRAGGHVTGFSGHMDVQTMSRAQESGIDAVLTRGQFTARINDVVSGKV